VVDDHHQDHRDAQVIQVVQVPTVRRWLLKKAVHVLNLLSICAVLDRVGFRRSFSGMSLTAPAMRWHTVGGMPASRSSDLTGRARLREAALRLFAERGYAGTSTRAVAAEAGVSSALVIHHFDSKEGLRAAVDEDVLGRLDVALRELDAGGDLMASLGEVSARMFGADPLLRGYLRRALQESSAASVALFGRLLDVARAELERLVGAEGSPTNADLQWAPFQMLCLILGPLLLEPVMQPNLNRAMFDPEVLAHRSAANQQLLRHGLFGEDAPAQNRPA
jgi:AcrR family transcriptional regulator